MLINVIISTAKTVANLGLQLIDFHPYQMSNKLIVAQHDN